MSVATVLLMVLAGFAAVPAGAGDEEKFEVIVLFNDKIDEQVIKDNNGKVKMKYSLIPAVVTKLTEKDITALEKSDKVKAVEKNQKFSIAASEGKPSKPGKPPKDPPTQPTQSLPWGVDRIDAEYLWGEGITNKYNGDGITVAVIDTGIDEDHPDLDANIIGGYNFVKAKGVVDNTAWDDDNGHGTHVAGTIAAENDQYGVVGVAPGANLYAIKVLNKRGSGLMSDVILGIQHAAGVDLNSPNDDDNAVDVISMSLSGGYSLNLANALQAAWDAGIILVAASGNDGTSYVKWPSAHPKVISVGATDSSDSVPWWSNYGTGLDFVAPGVSIPSTYKGGGYKTLSGTSMACPHVAGTVAVMLENGWTQSQIYGQLDKSADPIGSYTITKIGNGLVDAVEAVTDSATTGNDLP